MEAAAQVSASRPPIYRQSSGLSWKNAGSEEGYTHAGGDGIYAGKSNTAIIIAVHTVRTAYGNYDDDYAARLCNELQITEGGITYGDWYLPSLFELKEMFKNKVTIDATAIANAGAAISDNSYWSSVEFDFDLALELYSGSTTFGLVPREKEALRKVRAVRSF